jgi:hypothetical protein
VRGGNKTSVIICSRERGVGDKAASIKYPVTVFIVIYSLQI